MKKLIFVIFFVLVQFAFAEEGWYKLQSPTTERLEYVDFINKDFGIVGGDKAIYLTQDGCESFKLLDSNSDKSYFLSAMILNMNNILVSGIIFNKDDSSLNFIKKTTDLGLSWDTIYSELSKEGLYFRNLKLCNNKLYFASQRHSNRLIINHENIVEIQDLFNCIGEYLGLIDNTTDTQTGALKDFFFNYYKNDTFLNTYNYTNGSQYAGFILYDNFWFVNDVKGAYKSWDHGINWTKISNLKLYTGTIYFRSIFKLDIGYYYAYDSKIYKSNDFINLITCKIPNGIPWINSLKVVDKNIAYAVGNDGLILKTTDGGGVFTDVEKEIQESQEIQITSSKNSAFSLELKYPPSDAKLELINIMGVPIFSQSTGSQLLNISLEPYPTGIYLLKYTDKYSTQVFKLLRD